MPPSCEPTREGFRQTPLGSRHDVVARRGRLPGLPALVPGLRRRTAWGIWPGSRAASTTWRASAPRRSGSRRSTPRRWPTSATTSPTTRTSTRSTGRSRTSTAWSGPPTSAACVLLMDLVPCHTSIEHPWFREHPGALRLGRRPRRRSAQQLAGHLRGPGVDARPAQRALVPALLLPRAARPRLAQPGGGEGACRAWCASGSTAAWTASGSTRSTAWSRTRSCATTRRRPRPSRCRCRRSTRASSTSTPPTAPTSATRSARCARRPAMPCWWARSTSPPPARRPTSSTSMPCSPSSCSTRRGRRTRCARRSPHARS